MHLKLTYKYLRFCSVLLLTLFSCGDDGIFEKHPTYSYKIQNNTNAPLEVRITSNTIITNNGFIPYTVAVGATRGVWTNTMYYDDSWVYNFEKRNKEVTEFRIESLTKGGTLTKSNLNDAKRWSYERKRNYEATYILTVEETDF